MYVTHSGWHYVPSGFVTVPRPAPAGLRDEQLLLDWEAPAHFWLPNDSETRAWGRLCLSPGNNTAVVEGRLPGPEFPRLGIEHPTLHGVLYNGEPFTLFKAVCNVETHHAEEDHDRTTIHFPIMIRGGHFLALETVSMNGLLVRFSHLEEWFGPPYDHKFMLDGTDREELSFCPAEFAVEAEFMSQRFELSPRCQRINPPQSRGSLEFITRYYLRVRPGSDQSLQWFLSLASSLRRYLMFLLGRGVYTLELVGLGARGGQSGGEYEEGLAARVMIYVPVDVPLMVRRDRFGFVRHYDQVVDQLQKLTTGWFKHAGELATTMAAYADLLRQDSSFRESVFLRSVQTLEHYHGVEFPEDSRYLPKAAWKKISRSMKEGMPEALPGTGDGWPQKRNIIIDRFGSLNKLSFRSRIEKLFREMPAKELWPLFGNPVGSLEAHIDQFLERLTITRNFLTHYERKLKAKSFKGKELEQATAVCWAVLTYWIATRIGFDSETAGDMGFDARQAMFLVAPTTDL